METILVANVHQTKKKAATSTSKKRKKPVKVVYISNPKKFNTSATQFRALVQELTGQDSDPAKFVYTNYDDDVGGHYQAGEPPPLDDVAGDGDDDHQGFSLDPTTTAESLPDLPPPPPAPVVFAEPFDQYDGAFMPPHHRHHQTFEDNLSGFVFSDFSHVDLLRGVDAM